MASNVYDESVVIGNINETKLKVAKCLLQKDTLQNAASNHHSASSCWKSVAGPLWTKLSTSAAFKTIQWEGQIDQNALTAIQADLESRSIPSKRCSPCVDLLQELANDKMSKIVEIMNGQAVNVVHLSEDLLSDLFDDLDHEGEIQEYQHQH